MDAYEATRIVFSRIQTLDPENAAKIMGLLLIQDHGEKEMIRLAFGPETLLHSLISKAKKELNLPPSSPSSASSPSSVPASNNPFLRQNSSSRLAVAPPPPLSISSPTWAPQTDFFQDELISPDFTDSQLYGTGPQLRRSYSDLEPSGFGWKPCLYYARGFCKNGSACRFQHGLMPDADVDRMSGIEQELLLLRARSQRLGFPYSPLSPSSSSYLFQQNERAATAAAAAAMMLGGDDGYKYMGRPRMDPWSRQIYLTFPADSTFREEDVSNYFSIYGPVQDVRIPYQQKRMFGFVTFLYPETVKLILAKGNPHFVCDARVLVKPYKEKGKIPEKKIQGERGEFSAGNTPTGFDARDPFEFQQLGPRMMQNYNSNQEMLLRRKMEEQIQAAELQQAIEMQGRRFMGLQLLDFKNRSMSPSTTISSRTTAASNDRSYDSSPTEDKSPSPVLLSAMNPGNADKEESAAREAAMPNEDSNFQESGEHNLPDSPFASPTKGSSPFANDPFAVESALGFESEFDINQNGNHHIVSSSLLSPSSTLDIPSFRSCFLQMPRLSSGHGAVGL